MRAPGRSLVLGATGLVGSALVRRFVDDGWDVTASVRHASEASWIASALDGARVVTLAVALDGDGIAAVVEDARPDVVVNCMSMNPTTTGGAALAYGNMNVTAVAVVLEACVSASVDRVIVIGSGFEYAPSDHPLDERDAIGPTTLYGATKAAGTVIASYYQRGVAPEVCVARPFSVYGPRERLGRLVPSVITAALSGGPIEMSAGTQVRDYLYVEDLAAGLAVLAAHDQDLPGAINFSGPEQHTLLELVSIAVEAAAPETEVRVGSRAENPGDWPVFLGDSGRAERLLAWQPRHDLRSGIAQTVDWYRANHEAWEALA